jgi:medium-chain acyl-[acyl-carrier-protein] hydrolase
MIANNPWILSRKPNPSARMRLFCFPYAGKGASLFSTWPNGLPSEVAVCAIQLPGRETRMREKSMTRMAQVVQSLAEGLQPLLEMPFAFFGHSNGALISFELAQELRRLNRPVPLHLFASAQHAPQIPERHPPMSHLPEADFVQQVRRRYGGIPDEILREPGLLDLLLPILRADLEILETYVYRAEPPLDCPITVYSGLEDAEYTPADLEAWSLQTRSGFALRMFPGDHFFLQSAQSELLQAVSAVLKPTLDRLVGERNS